MFDKGRAALGAIWASTGIGLLATEQILAIGASVAAIIGSVVYVWYTKRKNKREEELHRLKVESYKRKRDDSEESDSQ